MNVLVVADVHGCYRTLKRFLQLHWLPQESFLIFVGDLINKGHKSGKVLSYVRQLQEEFPYTVHVVKGNHELLFTEAVLEGHSHELVYKTLKDLTRREVPIRKSAEWMRKLPLKWETPYLLITHAGIASAARNPYNERSSRGVLHNRSSLRSVGKLQIYGHAIQPAGKPYFNSASKSWGIDTGCWRGGGLSGLLLTYEGIVTEVIQVPTDPSDL